MVYSIQQCGVSQKEPRTTYYDSCVRRARCIKSSTLVSIHGILILLLRIRRWHLAPFVIFHAAELENQSLPTKEQLLTLPIGRQQDIKQI